MKPIDSVLIIQKSICLEILNQFKISTEINSEELKSVNQITISSTKNLEAYEFLMKGVELYNNQQYKDAIEMYNFALEIDRKYSKAYYKRGILNFLLNNYGRAASDFEKSTNYIRKDSIFYLMGNAYQKQGLVEKAYRYYRQAEKLNPTSFAIKKSLFEIQESKADLSREEASGNLKDTLYQTVFEYKEGIAKVRKRNKFGFIDTSEKIVIPVVFDEIRDYKYGVAAAKKGKNWGFIDKAGNWVVKNNYDEVEDFSELGLSSVTHKFKSGIINKEGKIIVPIQFDGIRYISIFKDSLIPVSKQKNPFSSQDLWGIYDITGKLVIPVMYDGLDVSTALFRGSFDSMEFTPYIHVSFNGKWGVVDRNNKIVVPFKYESSECIRKFQNGFFAVKTNEKWGVVNEKGIEVISPQFDQIRIYSLGFFAVKMKTKWGVINLNNSTVIPIEYDDIYHVGKKYWVAQKDKHWGVVDSTNTIICNFLYDGYEPYGYTRPVITEMIDKNGKIIKVESKDEIVIPVKKNGSRVFINEKCETIY